MDIRYSEINMDIQNDSPLMQGDIFKNVKYNYVLSGEGSTVDIEECIFPHAIIISQACDVDGASKLFIKKSGKSTKYMPSVLLCPIYEEDTYRHGEHIDKNFDEYNFPLTRENIYNSGERKIVMKNKHCRFHYFNIIRGGKSPYGELNNRL